MSFLRPTEERGRVRFVPEVYGASVRGLPLHVWLPGAGETDLLLFAAIHGEEPETTALLSKALRSLRVPPARCAVILSANPDGMLLGTRGNARGVELNRNFPATNWQEAPISARWSLEGDRVTFSTGARPGSEPETRALMSLVERLRPQVVIALHSPLGCIDDPATSPLGRWLARATDLPLVPDVGYPTPGSFGSWCREIGQPVITYELPGQSVATLQTVHLPVLIELLTRGLGVL